MPAKLVGSLLGAVILGLIGLGISLSISSANPSRDHTELYTTGFSLLGALVGFLVTYFLLCRAFQIALKSLSNVYLPTLFAGCIGMLIGLITALLLVFAFSIPSLASPWDMIAPGLIVLSLTTLGATIGTSQSTQFSYIIRGDSGSSSDTQPQNNQGIIVDTSAIIDGRIAEITHTGFVSGVLLVPGFVLEELQYVADSPDSLKRNRGRRGLDVLNKLQKDRNVEVQITDVEVNGNDAVDSKLVSLAKRLQYSLLTTDFNLNKVAELQGVKVLNINDLANSLKPALLPGEDITIHITQDGKEESQGVGFLDDGTMVVVEGGSRYLNAQLPVMITRVLQTSAGRIIFAHLK